jgi:hypothetical protein
VTVGRAAAVIALAVGLGSAHVASATCDEAGISWVRRVVSTGQVTLAGLAPTADGGLVIAGGHRGALGVDTPGAREHGPPLAKADGGFLLRLAADGSVRWLRELPGADSVGALALRPDGIIIVGGVREARLLVSVFAADGTPRATWAVGAISAGKARFGSATLTELAADAERVVLAGTLLGSLELGEGARKKTFSAVGSTELFVAALSKDGSLAWALEGGSSGHDAPGPLALGPEGAVAISGITSSLGSGGGQADPVTLGDAAEMHRTGGLDAFVARLDRQGRPAWASTVGGDEPWGLVPTDWAGAVKPLYEEDVAGVLVLPNGETLFAGNAMLPTLFAGKPLFPAGQGATSGSFIARVSAAGKLVAAAPLGPQRVVALASAPGGDLLIAGEVEGVAAYPATGPTRATMTSAGREDVFVARQASDGALRWVTRLGGRGHDRVKRVTIDARGAITVAANFGEGFAVEGRGCVVPPPPEFPRASVDLVRLAPGAPAGDDAREQRLAAERAALAALRDEAARAFKDKRYPAACAAYQKIAAARPDSAAALSDVGLCLHRLGKKKEAIAANRSAVVLGEKTEVSDEGEPAARKHAYFNLYKLGVRVPVPKRGCRKLLAEPGCRRSLWACTETSHGEGSGGSIDSIYVRVGTSRETATIDDGEYSTLGAEQSAPTYQRTHADVEVERTVESRCWEERDGPTCGDDDGTTSCEVVSANACLGLIGVACEDPAPKNGRASTQIEELRITPSP